MIDLVLVLSALFLAIILHEIAHGYMAYILGDPTAKREGRLSLNPKNHIDPVGTIAVPLVLFILNTGIIFGWAKPVPVNYYNLKKLKRDIILVSSAGIVMNLILAFASYLFLEITKIPYGHEHTFEFQILGTFFTAFMFYNIILALFNLIPIPPLDGSKMLFGWIEKPWAYKYLSDDRIGFGIIILVAFILPVILGQIGISFNLLGLYLEKTSEAVLNIFQMVYKYG